MVIFIFVVRKLLTDFGVISRNFKAVPMSILPKTGNVLFHVVGPHNNYLRPTHSNHLPPSAGDNVVLMGRIAVFTTVCAASSGTMYLFLSVVFRKLAHPYQDNTSTSSLFLKVISINLMKIHSDFRSCYTSRLQMIPIESCPLPGNCQNRVICVTGYWLVWCAVQVGVPLLNLTGVSEISIITYYFR